MYIHVLIHLRDAHGSYSIVVLGVHICTHFESQVGKSKSSSFATGAYTCTCCDSHLINAVFTQVWLLLCVCVYNVCPAHSQYVHQEAISYIFTYLLWSRSKRHKVSVCVCVHISSVLTISYCTQMGFSSTTASW